MSKSNQVAKSALIIVFFSLGSKLLGFIREILIASKFGSGMKTDTFFVAMTATSLIVGFLSSAISTTFIPILSEIESKEGKRGKIEHTNNMINVMFLLSTILVIICMAFTPLIIKLLAKGFQGEQFKLAVELTRIGLPMILFAGIIGIFTGYLQSEQKFISTSIIGIPFNIVYIFFLLFLSNKFGIKGLMVTAVIAVLSQVLIQIPEARNIGYKYILKFDLKDKYVKKVIALSVPVIIGVAINDLNAIVDRTLASSLVTGSISSLNYANRLNSLILGVFITAITTVIFPLLSKECSNDNISRMKKIMAYGINIILIITVPATVGLILFSNPIVEIAFQRGQFGIKATQMTSQALVFYSLGLVAMSLRLLLNRVYYSLQDTRTPMVNGAISVVFNIVLNIILVKFMQHSGLALATSISTIITVILLLWGLKIKIGSLGVRVYTITFLKTGVASIIMGLTSYLIYNKLYALFEMSKLYNLIALLVAVGVGIILYIILCYVFGVKEVKDALDKVKLRLVNK